MKTILVTGTAGFIGFHLAGRLLERGDRVIGLDSINDYYEVQLKYDRLAQHGIAQAAIQYGTAVKSSTQANYTFYQVQLEDRAALEAIFEQYEIDAVVNLAAQAGVRYSLVNPQAYIDSNIVGFLNILECCRHHEVGHLAYASSSSVYGLNESTPFATTDNVDHPVSLYAASKKSNELMAHTYSHLFGVPTTGLRFFTVYGPWGRPDMALFLFTKAMLNDQPIKVFNYGNMRRDFTYIDDIVDGIVKVVDHPPKGKADWSGLDPDPGSSKAPYRVYNIGNSQPVQLLDFIEAIEAELGVTAKKEMLPIQPGDVEQTYADVTGLKNELGYQPATPIQTGIKAFLDWYRAYYA